MSKRKSKVDRREIGSPYRFYVSAAPDAVDQDPNLRKFHGDLCAELAMVLPLPVQEATAIGFFDESTPEHGGWISSEVDALQSSQSLVCLYSPAYFASVHCGKVFEVFRSRAQSVAAARSVILPVLWAPPRSFSRRMPAVAAAIQYTDARFGEAYSKEGLRGLMKLKRHSDEYRQFLHEFALLLAELLDAELLPPLSAVPAWNEVPNAFEPAHHVPTGGMDASSGPTEHNTVFVSYSHGDEKWLQELQKMLKPLARKQQLSVWADTSIAAGSPWNEQIEQAIASAKVAVVLVSPHYLASEWTMSRELPRLIETARRKGTHLAWVCLTPCLWQHTPFNDLQAIHDPRKPLDQMPRAQRTKTLVEICEKIAALALDRPEVAVNSGGPQPANVPEIDWPKLAFRLVLARHASPDLLLHVEPSKLREAVERIVPDVRGAVRFAQALERLESQQAGIHPNPLWLAWIRTTQTRALENLNQQLFFEQDSDPVAS